jgi:DNA primase
MKSARAEEAVVVLSLREPALLDLSRDLKPEMFSVPLLAKAYTQICDRHTMGLDVSLGCLVNFEPEEMSHIAGLLRQQEGPVSEQAFCDCVQIIKREHQTSSVKTEEDLMALRNRMKERKGIKG